MTDDGSLQTVSSGTVALSMPSTCELKETVDRLSAHDLEKIALVIPLPFVALTVKDACLAALLANTSIRQTSLILGVPVLEKDRTREGTTRIITAVLLRLRDTYGLTTARAYARFGNPGLMSVYVRSYSETTDSQEESGPSASGSETS